MLTFFLVKEKKKVNRSSERAVGYFAESLLASDRSSVSNRLAFKADLLNSWMLLIRIKLVFV